MIESQEEKKFNEHITGKTGAIIGLVVLVLLIVLSFIIPNRAN